MLLFSLIACSPLGIDDNVDRRIDDRDGDVELPIDLVENESFSDFLKNCKSEYSSVPDNTVDIVTGMFGLDDQLNPGKKVRDCLKAKLEDAQNRICKARDELERRRGKARSDTEKSRIDNSLLKLDQIQFNFNQKLYDLALSADEQVIKIEQKDSKNAVGRFFNWWAEEESGAIRDILETESYNECNSYYSEEV